MKIGQPTDNQLLISSAAAQAKGNQSAGLATAISSSTLSAGVAVTVSSLARSMASPGRGDAPDVDLGKVDAMKLAISNGQFHFNPEAIADKLLRNAHEMLTRQRS